MATYTPMMEQYLSVKAQAQDAFLFFRLGDFYEMFFEDAVLASRELEITLTGRGAGGEERVPMCGIPYHSAEAYITKLIEKGYKVAICEQVENPAAAKGVVKREIVRVVTPGTVMEGKALPDRANNYLAAVTERNGRWALAICDLTTGELYTTATDTPEELVDELNVYNITELLAPALEMARMQRAEWDASRRIAYTTREAAADEAAALAAQFVPAKLQPLDNAHRKAVALLLTYLTETQKRSLQHISEVHVYAPDAYMTLDPFTRKNLELTETVRDRSRKGSLLWMLDKTVTAMGARLLRRWLDKPLMQIDAIRRRQDAVEALIQDVLVRDDVRERLKGMYDLERLAGRIAYGTANARDLNALRATLASVPELLAALRGNSADVLARLAEETDDCRDLREWIEAAVHPEPPASLREGGIIRDGYHERLDQLREASGSGKRWIAELEQAERGSTGIRTLKIGYNKVFGYYIEVSRSNLHLVPEGRYERKQTLAAAERYVTPELKEKEALILEAEEKTVDLEYGLFAELRDRLAGEIPRLQRLAERIATVDALQSLGTVAALQRYVRPDVHEGFDFEVEEGRHPVVEAVLERGTFIANGTQLTSEATKVLLITGPNMAGKSTYMRQVALLSILAQIGSFVPARRARIPIVDRVFTRIGAADDLAGGQSTFMVEMRDIQAMIAKATPRSLVVIDELGRGTSTGEGMAIAQAVIEHLHEHVACKTLVSTHYHELAHLENTLPNLSNACMAVKESGGKVTFLRKLAAGAADSSYGIYCAQLAGLPSTVIDRAYSLLRQFEGRSQAAAERESYRQEAAAAVSRTHVRETAAGGIEQLDLFAAPWTDPLLAERAARAEAVVDSLLSADVMNMTPLEAMNFVYELQRRAKLETKRAPEREGEPS